MIFDVEEKIDAPRDDVWRYLTEPALMSRWMPGVKDVNTNDGEPLEPGKTFTFEARGKKLESLVAAMLPGEQLTLRSTQGAFTATYAYRVRDVGQGTLVRLQADCVADGVSGIFAPVIRMLMRMSDSKSLVSLREAVESGA